LGKDQYFDYKAHIRTIDDRQRERQTDIVIAQYSFTLHGLERRSESHLGKAISY